MGINRIFERPDFRRQPAVAIMRRLLWRLRWFVLRKPWSVRLGDGSKIFVPKSGTGALIYYQGYSEPNTVFFVQNYLKAGMIFFDIGAHVGEFTVVAIQRTGPEGEVHAFEPNPAIFKILQMNTSVRGESRSFLNNSAVWNKSGAVWLHPSTDPSTASVLPSKRGQRLEEYQLRESLRVSAITLDTYVANLGKFADLVKMDVEGAELMVLEGATSLLRLGKNEAPVWVLEYSPVNYRTYGYSAEQLLSTMRSYGYKFLTIGQEGLPREFLADSISRFEPNLVATKSETRLLELLKS